MPLTELMHYFNDQLQTQARAKALPKTGFYKVDNNYWARFGSLILGSQFFPIYKTTIGNDRLGHFSHLIVRSATGKNLSIDEIFTSLDVVDQIVHLDRLIRTLHSLNYLQQHDGEKGLLALSVQPRHIVSVTGDHGKIFEAILSDCGLGPERVLLHTHLLDESSFPHFRSAFSNYKSRGYLIGANLEKPRDVSLLENLAFEPDVILFHSSLFKSSPVSHKDQTPNIADLLKKYQTAKRFIVSNDISTTRSHFDGYLSVVDFSTDKDAMTSIASKNLFSL